VRKEETRSSVSFGFIFNCTVISQTLLFLPKQITLAQNIFLKTGSTIQQAVTGKEEVLSNTILQCLFIAVKINFEPY